MGVYSQYAAFEGGSAVVTNESYVGAAGAYRMMEESSMNEHAIFEAVIGRDFAEAYCALSDGTVVSESTVDALNEASLGGIWEKVVAFIQKIWEKIKGILKSIKDKIQAVFIRDGKALVNKYHKQVQKKMTDGKLSKFKFKWRKFNGNLTLENANKDDFAATCFSAKSKVGKNVKEDMDLAESNDKDYSKYGNTDRSNNPNLNYADSKNTEKMEKAKGNLTGDERRRAAIKAVNNTDETEGLSGVRPYTSDEITEMKENLLGLLVPNNSGDISVNDFAKEYEDAIFDSVEELEYKDFDSMFNDIEENLKTGKKSMSTIEREERSTDKYLKEQKRNAENIQKKYSKLAGKNEDRANAAAANRTASRAITCYNIIQECAGKYFTAVLASHKLYLKQARAAYIKAATWNQSKAFEENAIFCEAVEDVSNYEVEEMFSCM